MGAGGEIAHGGVAGTQCVVGSLAWIPPVGVRSEISSLSGIGGGYYTCILAAATWLPLPDPGQSPATRAGAVTVLRHAVAAGVVASRWARRERKTP